ncbi:MAG: HAMP domain-containing histidine kinase [Elusimicrobia bacterium]|nr:HAMP domain-containing histidine kinase [Elusimicrobiota bacterium]
MSIRLKLAFLLSFAIAFTAAGAAAVFFVIEDGTLRAGEEEKVRILMQSVRTMAVESQLAKDPLMLLDYLSYLSRDRPQVLSARANFSGRWQDAEGAKPVASDDRLRTEIVTAPEASGQRAVVAAVNFSTKAFEQRIAAARAALAADLGGAALAVLLVGVLLSIPLGWTMTRRLIVIERALADVGEGRLDRKIPDRGSDEVAKLAKGVNAMTARLRELEDMKRTFVASVTHELRSPLFSIDSYVRMLLAEAKGLNPEERRQLERIQQNAARLAHFVTSLLNTAKIERGSMECHPRLCDLARLVEDAALFQRPRAAEEGKTLLIEIEPGLPQLHIDPDLITQVVTNLVSNAVKFTRRGGRVTVGLKRAVDAGRGVVECFVADTGVGIPAEALPNLFRPFGRVKNSISVIGTGLGLSIVKSLVELNGGTVGVESVPERGSRFCFRLPLDNKSLTGKPRI